MGTKCAKISISCIYLCYLHGSDFIQLCLRWSWVFLKSRLQNDVRRLGHGLAGLFSQQILLHLTKQCSNQHAEIFMNETNMRRFEILFTNRISSS